MSGKPVLGIIGAGKVGQTLARLLYQASYTIGAIYNRTPATAVRLARLVNSTAVMTVQEVAGHADLILLTVPDDAIEWVAEQLTASHLAGKGVMHTSGVHDAKVLSGLAAHGAMIGSLHPAYPFADVEIALRGLAGATFALEAESNQLADWLTDMVHAMSGSVLRIPPGGKALYHAALVIASNYMVTLYAAAERLLLTLSEDRAAVDGALNALVGATANNLRGQGIPDALTGPLVRGDAGTIESHLTALARQDAQLAALYRELARLSLPILRARGIPIDTIENLLSRT
jgi:predicted short-subunit dehydrogenase-like oxidoreductase (DUF2520 family)